MITCEQCGSRNFESRWKGLTYEFRCVTCQWGAVTTCFPPILADQGAYRIIVTSLGADESRSLVALNRAFSHGIRRTRELFSAGEREYFASRAYDVWHEAQKLIAEGIPFRIEPPFPYDLATYDVAHAHEHDWLPIPSEGDS
jgi:hypothetical protein